MTNPLFWLVLSLLFVTISLTIVLLVLVPTLKELGRAARSAEKLFETLRREFPPTLEAIRLTGMEITDLTDDLSEGVQSAGNVVKQVDQTITGARTQAKKVQSGTRSLLTGVKAAWKSFARSQPQPQPQRRVERLPASKGSPESLDTLRDRPESRLREPEPLSSTQPSFKNEEPQTAERTEEEGLSGVRFISKAGEIHEQVAASEVSTPPPQAAHSEATTKELFEEELRDEIT